MKFTISWLKEYLVTDASLQEICHKLNNIGLEVESLEDQAQSISSFSVAKIIEALPHPNSNKLQICMVDVGGKENLQIICGAKNARSGIKVAYAPIDSTIPNGGMKIKKAKIAGIESFGMLCSAFELGVGSDGEGIIEVDEKFAIGTKISEVFGLDEAVIEINVTPNRGDCLGVFGIARDLASSGLGVLKLPEIKTIKGNFISPVKAKIADEIYPQNCCYFSGFYIKNITNCDSPKWLKQRLEAIGCNSISAIVDITNYIMFSQNQPTHCYDADQLSGDILVRFSTQNENFKSLKDQNYQLPCGQLVIENNQQIAGLAGIIGGQKTAVTKDTKNIFLEAAFFNPENISVAGRSLNILSDARFRFERCVDLANVKNALKMAANLILEICGGEISEVVEVGSNVDLKPEIDFDLNQIQKIIGIKIEKDSVVKILENLGFKTKECGENLLQVQVPSHRSDIKIYQDLVEEVIRIYGLHQIKSEHLKKSDENVYQKSELEIIREQLAQDGFVETINYSFVDEKIASLFGKIKKELVLQNPIAIQMNYMRPNLLIGLLQNISKNQARGFEDLSLFEIGKIFLGVKKDQQKNVVVAARINKNKPKDHYADQRVFDVFDIKKDLFLCLENLGFSGKALQMFDEAPNYYHPYRSTTLKLGKNIIGHFGELHPLIAKKLDVKGKANIFELFIEELPLNLNKKSSRKSFVISDLLPVNRDFAFVVDEKIAVGNLLKKVAEIDRNLITEVNLFDVYQDQKLGDDKKSIAFSIQIQPCEKTLTSEEIEAIGNKVILKVKEDFGGVLRG